jgi:hypothetical protein
VTDLVRMADLALDAARGANAETAAPATRWTARATAFQGSWATGAPTRAPGDLMGSTAANRAPLIAMGAFTKVATT